MNAIEKKIYNIKPAYREDFDTLVKRHSQFGGGSDDSKFSQGRSFSNAYEVYIYSFFIGIQKDTQLTLLPGDESCEFWEVNAWQPRELTDYLLSCAIGRSEFDMFNVQHMDADKVTTEVRKIKHTIESYANGGLKYINDLLVSEPDLIDDDTLFIRLLSNKP